MHGRRFCDCDRYIVARASEGLAHEILGPRVPLLLAITVITTVVIRVKVEWLVDRARLFCCEVREFPV
jgi:hypothetical protein